MTFNVGDKVTYSTSYKKEYGIVKRIADEDNSFVVYNCDNNWDDFENYTAARTSNKDLILGWV